MTTIPFSEPCFDLLKTKVLHKAGIIYIKTGIKMLESLIVAHTRQHINQDTLSKAFGLTPSRFKPSVHTLDTLALFCDHKSWEAFCKLNEADS